MQHDDESGLDGMRGLVTGVGEGFFLCDLESDDTGLKAREHRVAMDDVSPADRKRIVQGVTFKWEAVEEGFRIVLP